MGMPIKKKINEKKSYGMYFLILDILAAPQI